MKKLIIKIVLIILSIMIFFFVLIIGSRYLRYYDFIGEFTNEQSAYYKFNLFSWSYSEDITNTQKCDLWNCHNDKGSYYYIKDNRLHLRYDKNSVFITNYKIEKKNNKTYLYLYGDSNELEHKFIKK